MDTYEPHGDAAPPWPAPAAAGPVRARLRLPGSKSMTNRALVLAALADGPSAVSNPLRARDTLLMARALAALGATIETGAPPGTGTTPEPSTAGPPSPAQRPGPGG